MHLWTCPALREDRVAADPELADIGVDIISAHLLLGVPSKIRAGNHSTFFEPSDLDKFQHVPNRKVSIHELPQEPVVQKAINDSCPPDEHFDTLQLVYKLLGCTGASPRPRIQWCNDAAPEKPNLWTGGSYQHPGC